MVSNNVVVNGPKPLEYPLHGEIQKGVGKMY